MYAYICKLAWRVASQEKKFKKKAPKHIIGSQPFLRGKSDFGILNNMKCLGHAH